MKRRVYLRFLCAGGAVLLLGGHSPYRQWDAYRKARLVLLVSATDETSVRLAEALVAIFAHRLPESRATYARARDTNDLVRLIASKQLEVALLREGDAHAVFTGAEPFADNGRVALRTLGALGEHLFVCLEEVPKAAAYMLVEALAERWRDLDAALVRQASGPNRRRRCACRCTRVLSSSPGSRLICDAPEVADKTGETAGFRACLVGRSITRFRRPRATETALFQRAISAPTATRDETGFTFGLTPELAATYVTSPASQRFAPGRTSPLPAVESPPEFG